MGRIEEALAQALLRENGVEVMEDARSYTEIALALGLIAAPALVTDPLTEV